MASELWDDIVVGAGSAGCVVAARLSEDRSRRVLLLEAGPRETVLMKPFGLSYFLDFSRFEWGYYSQPDPTRNMRRDHWRRGRVVGGSGSINGMNYVRGLAPTMIAGPPWATWAGRQTMSCRSFATWRFASPATTRLSTTRYVAMPVPCQCVKSATATPSPRRSLKRR